MESWSRVSMTQASHAMLAPMATASVASRSLRGTDDSCGVCRGSSAKPISSSTVATTSTVSCVNAKSGAEKLTKLSDVTRPTAPATTTD